MSSPSQADIVKELYSRKDSLPKDKQAVIEELYQRFNNKRNHYKDQLEELTKAKQSGNFLGGPIMMGPPGAAGGANVISKLAAGGKAALAPKAGGRLAKFIEGFKAAGKTAEEALKPGPVKAPEKPFNTKTAEFGTPEKPFNVKTAEFGEGGLATAPAKAAPKEPDPVKAPEKTSRTNRGDPDKQNRSDTIKDLHRHAKAIPLAEKAVKDGVTSKQLLELPEEAKADFMKRIGLEGRSEDTWRTFVGHVQRLEKSK